MRTGSRLTIKSIAKWAISASFLTLTIAWLLLQSSVLSPIITISTSRFPTPQSQLFYKHQEAYKESNSAISKLDTESQTFQFTLPRYDDDLRWDPLEKPGSFYVKAVTIKVFAYSSSVNLNKMTPLAQIEKTERSENHVQFIASAGATDPQINIHISSKLLDKLRLITALLLGLATASLILGWVKWHDKILEFMQGDRAYTRELRTLFAQENFSLSEFTKLLGIGVVLNIIPIVNFFLSVDDERGAFRTDPSVWIADGRWTAFLVEKLIFPQPVMPYVPHLFFYTCLALSYMFILRAHSLKFNWISALSYCIFIAHPIWWFIGEFYSNIPSTGIGMLMLSIGIYIFSKSHTRDQTIGKTIKQALFSSFLLSLAIGAYQSLVMFYIAAGLGAIIFDYRKNNLTTELSLTPTFRRITLLFATLVGGVILYAIFNKIAQLAYPSERSYIDNFLRINELISDPFLITRLVLKEAWKLYSGSISTYGVSFFSSAIILGLAVLFLLTQKTWKALIWMALLVAAMLIAPFLLNFVAGGIYLPLRAMLAISFVAWIATIVVLEKNGLMRVIGTGFALILLFQMVSVNGQYSASTIMATNHDRLTAETLYARISEANPKFDRDEPITVDVYGHLPFSSRYPAPETSTMSSSFFNWDQGNVYRMMEYMRLIGFTNVYATGNAARIPLTPHFDKMPVWPAEGSVRYQDGIYFVKLSETPDPTHALYKQDASHE